MFRFSEKLTFGLDIKNLYGFSVKEEYDRISLPKYVVVGISTLRNGYRLAMDSEYIFGRFGGLEKKTANIWFLRAGLEKQLKYDLLFRMGLIYPVVVRTSSIGDVTNDIPWPKIGGTLGIGADLKYMNLDLVLYGDPAKSYLEQQAAVSIETTVTLKF
jgi:hypothetical protein